MGFRRLWLGACGLQFAALWLLAHGVLVSQAGQALPPTWPRDYVVEEAEAGRRLVLSNPYYAIEQDLAHGGAISRIQLAFGRATNLLASPIQTRVQTEDGVWWTDAGVPAHVSRRSDGLAQVVTVESALADEHGKPSRIRVQTVIEYRWGYLKIHKQLSVTGAAVRVREVCPFSTTLAPDLSDYGYREGRSEPEGAPAFSFGSNLWGKLRRGIPSDRPLKLPFVPRSMLFADPGVEGLEWFAGSDLSQWELGLAGRRGQGQCSLEWSERPAGLALAISPFLGTNAVALPMTCAFDFRIGIPIIDGKAQRPWLHASFNRNRGEWVSSEQIQHWAQTGIQTVHCHNDGDYYDDGLFWRDGSYPPYPDMGRYDQVIAACHQAGIRIATYFSDKELHPSTEGFRQHGLEWGRMDGQGRLQHNSFKGTNEFGAQMCLRSGWLEFLKASIDRVLKNHPLDGVYYDWNVALFCANARHEGKEKGAAISGHWDMDELLDLMEWTRRRVGPNGLVIIHNTTTPMFATENLADCVVANEWGYGQWGDQGVELTALPLEWSLVGARSRGVISYGQITAQAPKALHQQFALEALLSGVTPWPAGAETFELLPLLKPIGDLHGFRFADWRNQAVSLDGRRCASAIYSRPGEAFLLIANLAREAQDARCVVHPERLPCALARPASAALFRLPAPAPAAQNPATPQEMDAGKLIAEGITVSIPAESAVLVHLW